MGSSGKSRAGCNFSHPRLTTMGELAASIAHEVNQPLTGITSTGNACLRLLASVPVGRVGFLAVFNPYLN